MQKTSRSRRTSGDDDDGEAEDGIVKVVAVAQERWAVYREESGRWVTWTFVMTRTVHASRVAEAVSEYHEVGPVCILSHVGYSDEKCCVVYIKGKFVIS